MGIETVRVLGTTAVREQTGRDWRKYSMLVKGTIWYILSAVTESLHEALLEGETAHAP